MTAALYGVRLLSAPITTTGDRRHRRQIHVMIFPREVAIVSKRLVFRDKHDHEVNIRRSRVTRRTSRFGGGIVLHWNFVFFCICNGDPIAILLSEDDRQARRWGLSLSLSPPVHMESANVTAAISFSTTKSVLCQPCTLSLWY